VVTGVEGLPDVEFVGLGGELPGLGVDVLFGDVRWAQCFEPFFTFAHRLTD
jgi:hypothetical protein